MWPGVAASGLDDLNTALPAAHGFQSSTAYRAPGPTSM